jgi:dihydrofolate synthase / folylpolyglutamate synthase
LRTTPEAITGLSTMPFKTMTYSQTLEYLYARLPMFHRVGAAAYKKDLTNTLALCAGLGDPHRKFPAIHVGGTNGKGSVSYMLAAVCQAAGLKTGLYVSPHYKDFRERIRIDGQYIARRDVVDFVMRCQPMIEAIEPSFFEVCVAMAFDHFARQKVDIAIIEVGLGGRLDSTNVITPLVSTITNISYDHMNLLGDTLPLIAAEKAGIIKPGVPVVIGETHPESAPVFLEKARSTASAIVFADQNIAVTELGTPDFRTNVYAVTYREPERHIRLTLDAAGPFQVKNLATALQTIAVLNGLHAAQPNAGLPGPFPEAIVADGLARLRTLTGFMGRWQIIGEQPTIMCDSAHNEAGLRAVLTAIDQGQWPGAATPSAVPPVVHIVLGFVNDKDIDQALRLFPPNARYYFAKANIPRGLAADVLRRRAAGMGLRGRAYTSVKNALKAARRAAAPTDLIMVTGSIFVVGEVL